VRLSDFVPANQVVIPLRHDTVIGAADELIERLAAAGSVSNVDKLRTRVAEERPEDIVAMGDRAFLLHYRTDAVNDLRVALGTARQPICRELGENETQCARILLLIVAPKKFAAEYLQLVGAFARLLSKQPVVEELLAQPDAASFAGLPMFRDYELPAKLTVRDIMTYHPRTIDPDTVLKDAAREMVRLGVGGLPVVDRDGLVVGMLGERELLRSLSGYLQGGRGEGPRAPGVPAAPKPTVRDAMTRQVLCVSPDEAIADVSSMMTNKDVDRVPVVRDGRILGLLTPGDIVRKLLGL
jgi:CBS domain-containing protein/mannitol/fructose-specific phosphotransferase system IIA component (Ntr-type)